MLSEIKNSFSENQPKIGKKKKAQNMMSVKTKKKVAKASDGQRYPLPLS